METYRSQIAMPEFESVPVENWNAGDGPIRRILKCTRPTLDSECHRSNVVWFIQKLIHTHVRGVKVLRYGSGPLRTYLPDGDIDLTIVSNAPHLECNLPGIIYRVLEAEIHRQNGQGILKEAKFVIAKVNLIKCVVGDIMVDISFNQMSGLYALCFLDQVDLYIQKDHLFKQSIILIKTWCYHESRLMGAARGLISTYALETLVLHIFQVYDTSLDNPLMVLYRFLEYYGKFEWNKFAVSIRGPVDVSKLPFTCSVVNIIDPLKPSNNLGKSVLSGTFARITIALDLGAHKLGKILQLPKERIPEGIHDFFQNTVKMHPLRVDQSPRRLAELVGNYELNERNLQAAQLNAGYPKYSLSVNQWINWVRLGSSEAGSSSGAPSLVHAYDSTLKFGSFDPDFMSSVEPEPTDVGRRGKRVQNAPLPMAIGAVKHFPLATMIATLAFWYQH